MTSKEVLEEQPVGPEIIVIPQTQMSQMEDVNVLEIPADEVAPEDLPERIVVRQAHSLLSLTRKVVLDPEPVLTTLDETGPGVEDITGDAKLFQEAATEYQLAYQSLDKKYSEQAVLVLEASEALKASQSCVEELQKEMEALKQSRESDIQLAVGGMVLQYEQRLSSEQSRAQAQQTTITELQGQIQVLQESLTNQRELPSVPSARG